MWHRRLPWAISAIALILVVVQVPKRVTENVSESTKATEWLFAFLVVLCALLGAFILSRQGNNMVGWILLTVGTLPSVASLAEVHVHSLDSAQAQPTMGLVFALWVENLSWLALIFPLLHLLLVFPTGRLLSPRWKWVVILECTLIGFIVLSALTTGQLGPIEGDWTIDNPIGLGLDFFALPIVNSLWNLCLATIALAGAASMLLRYRRSDYAQRQQIKLLLFAFLAWAISFALSVSLNQGSEDWPGLIFALSIVLIPIAIAFAILRKGLFDINVIIRRTVVYFLLTGVLTLVYLGSIFLTQNVFGLRERASWQVAGSTLLVTALFAPVRRRIQRIIDRRLFRRRYDAQLVVERFAGAAQAQSDLDRLSADLVNVVQITIEPAHTRLWIRP